MLLDEPFAALGPALRREQGLIVVLVSHHPDDARRISGRSAFLHEGRILAVDRTERLLSVPALPELRAYPGDVTMDVRTPPPR